MYKYFRCVFGMFYCVTFVQHFKGWSKRYIWEMKIVLSQGMNYKLCYLGTGIGVFVNWEWWIRFLWQQGFEFYFHLEQSSYPLLLILFLYIADNRFWNLCNNYMTDCQLCSICIKIKRELLILCKSTLVDWD